MPDPTFDRIAILGLGLMGGSIAAGLRQRGLARQISAWDRNVDATGRARETGLIDEVAPDIASAISGAELIVLAVPVRACLEVLQEVALEDQVLTDVGSVKMHVIDAVRRAMGDVPPR